MEKRFRERSERHGGGPVSTGEIDGKVSDEMRQFFDESTMTLQNVVPQLKEGDQGEQMLETTGEIRKKIDEFFSDVGDPGAPPAAAPAPTVEVELPASAMRSGAPAPAARGAVPAAPAAPPAPRARSFSRPFGQPPAAGAEAGEGSAQSPAAAAPAESGQMDLKTALEKLRRHGSAKSADPFRPAAQTPAQRAAAAPAQRQPFSAPPMRPAAPAQQAPVRPAATRAPGAAPSREPSSFLPSPDELPPRRETPADRKREVSKLPPLSTDDIPAAPPPELMRLRPRQGSDDVVASAPPRPAAAPEKPAAAELPRRAAAEGDNFDSIFDEVQDIVLGTLKVSVSETLASARSSESELAEVAVPTAEPTADPTCEMGPNSQSQRVEKFVRPEEDEEEEKDEAPKGPYDWGVKAAAKPRGAWLLDAPDETAVPQGDAPCRTVTSEILSASVAAASAAAAAGVPPSAGAAGGGARAYLVRKANDEVKRFQPVLRALRESKVLDAADVAGKAAPATASGDEFVSAESFKDDRLSPEELEQELSPMRLVEELRRLKRVTQALIAKGVISADDLNKAAGD